QILAPFATVSNQTSNLTSIILSVTYVSEAAPMAPDPGALQLNVEAAHANEKRDTRHEKRDSASLTSTSPQGTRSTTLRLSPLSDDAVDSGVRRTGGQSGRSYWPGAWPERARPGAPVCLDCGQNDVQMV